MQEEIFGPVVCVTPFDTEEEVINRANNVKNNISFGHISLRQSFVHISFRSSMVYAVQYGGKMEIACYEQPKAWM
jgi:hypothetical protein